MSDPFFRELHGKMQACGATYVGHRTRLEVPSIMREHDIACVLSRSMEPFGLVVLEAMASGCAVIASERGGLPEACGGAAELVDPEDLTQVTEAIRGLANERDKLTQVKKGSVIRAARASWDVTSDAMIQSVVLA